MFEITGSSIYEDKECGEFILSFVQSTRSDSLQIYPQDSIQQKWALDYPLLAYKSVSPDNREIVIANLAQTTP